MGKWDSDGLMNRSDESDWRMGKWGSDGGTGLAALSLPQGLSLPVVAYIIKLFLPFPFI